MVFVYSVLFILSLIVILIGLIYIIYSLFDIYFYSLRRYVIFVPTKLKKSNLEQIFNFLQSLNLHSGKFIDLGCGDGRVVREFAKRGFKSYGVDINSFLVLMSKLITKLQKLNNAYFFKGDFFKWNLGDFDIVYIYQLPEVNKILASKFEKEMKPGSIIISNSFPLPETEKIKLIKTIDKFLIYKVG